jgi:hypothetical protein
MVVRDLFLQEEQRQNIWYQHTTNTLLFWDLSLQQANLYFVLLFLHLKKMVLVQIGPQVIDITVIPEYGENKEIIIDADTNAGKGEYFPIGPTCNFRGKNIHCVTLSSPSGSITKSYQLIFCFS